MDVVPETVLGIVTFACDDAEIEGQCELPVAAGEFVMRKPKSSCSGSEIRDQWRGSVRNKCAGNGVDFGG